MADARLNSGHFDELPRRFQYRQARQGLMSARGVLTLTAEHFGPWINDTGDWPSNQPLELDEILPGVKYYLFDYQGRCSFPIKTGFNTLGRLPSNNIVLEDISISRRHCVVLAHARGGCEVHDTASMNGTFVNGQRVRNPVALVSGDWVQVSKRLLRFVDAEAESSADPEQPETWVV
jgi:pSer/pThr/pTyr-binding forkhead associated (FHA) protein